MRSDAGSPRHDTSGMRLCQDVNAENYLNHDSGCSQASFIAGRQVECLECPLEECLYIARRDRGRAIKPLSQTVTIEKEGRKE